MADEQRLGRVARLVEAARTLADPRAPQGVALRRRLLETTRLSAENVELCLNRCLEVSPSAQELEQLVGSTPEAPVAHVLLSGNVFVAALRAIALGAASSPHVFVRASRRDPALAEALQELSPGSFTLVPELRPAPGERVWAYGADETLRVVRMNLPRGAWFHAHGAGFGAVVLEPRALDDAALRELGRDTVCFDQRGCLSPRVVCVAGGVEDARRVARSLAAELSRLAEEIPLGPQTPEEAAEARRHRDAAAYAFELFDAGRSWVSVSDRFVLPPVGRNMHVLAHDEPNAALRESARYLTTVASNDAALRRALQRDLPRARVVELGRMQRPPLDGPVDLRAEPGGELVRDPEETA
jgi:Acyl-CoA reductase (LuxC)